MEDLVTVQVIKRATDDDVSKVKALLTMTQEEFDQIVSKHEVVYKSVQTYRHHDIVFAEAKADELSGYELKGNNFTRVDTDVFEKAMVLLHSWADIIMREMIEKNNLRIAINYNAENTKTDIAVHTPIECSEESSK